MKRPAEILRDTVLAVREPLSGVGCQSERTILLGTVLLATIVSAVTGFVLAQYYSVDVLSSLIFVPDDCYLDWGMKAGRHCFSDYTMPVSYGLQPNPWAPFPLGDHSGRFAYNNYPAAGMVPQMIFGIVGKWLGAPLVGLIGYLLALTTAVFSPAAWAARGASGLERILVFAACGIAAVPAWMAIDRGNSAGFVVPVALVFLVALCRRRWGLAATMVVLAALIKPQFALLAVALFAARQWRRGGIALGGAVFSNVAGYALWPRDFPETIAQSIHNVLGYGSFQALVVNLNVSFAKGLLLIPDGLKGHASGGAVPDGYLAGPRSWIGYLILALVVVSLLVLGRRISPVMAGIVLLATASLFPALSQPYYLVFVLPVAAVVVRDPDGPAGTGIFERASVVGGSRRVVGICVSLAAALSIAQMALPSPPIPVGDITGQMGAAGTVARTVVISTLFLAPLVWLVTCGAIIVSYARRPMDWTRSDEAIAGEGAQLPLSAPEVHQINRAIPATAPGVICKAPTEGEINGSKPALRRVRAKAE